MKTNILRSGLFTTLLLLLTSYCMAGSKEKVHRSPNGFTATFIVGKEEGTGTTVIKNKEGKEITRIAGAYPMSFSPVSDILLLKEIAADDDTRQYLLDIGAGELKKKGKRMDYVFGSRYVTSARWSKDGKTITLVNAPGITDDAEEIITVADVLKKK
ncbi:hypothetical protein NT6N_21090 [Oceaniferula spumae]|uniref:DUF4412 domain-containing protein n=1 Tax=Oceaniferula spumae TaxID=2979115 RepID=A0AAT9FMC4_9BACT